MQQKFDVWRLVILFLATLALAPASLAQDGGGSDDGGDVTTEPVTCPGCTGRIRLGATVAAPGYTIGVTYGNPQGQGPGVMPDGKCQRVEGICTQLSGCNFVTRLTFGTPAGQTVPLVACWWVQADDGTWGWNCITVNPGFTGGPNTHDEFEGVHDCGEDTIKKLILGPASQVYSLKCADCDD